MASTSGERGGGGKRTSVRTLVWTMVAACVLGLPALAGASTEQRVGPATAGPSSGKAIPQSTPSQAAPQASTRFVDPTGDAQPGGMDIAGVTVSVENARLTFAIEIPTHETMPPAKFIGIGIDGDRNPGTGNFAGLEYRIWVDGSRNSIQFDFWTGTAWLTLPLSGLTGSFQRGETVSMGATTFGGESFDFVVETVQQDGNTLDDVAPNQGRWTVAMCAGLGSTIVGTDGPDQLTGTPGADIIVGLGGDDTLDGGDESDAVCGDAGSDSVSGGAGNDQVVGGSEPDQLFGGDGTDAHFGGDGDDRIDGGPGDYDGVLGAEGNDVLEGGEGVDIVVYLDGPTSGVQVSLATGVATGVGTDRLSGFEAIGGSPWPDTLEGDGLGNFFFPDVPSFNPSGADDVVRGGGGFDIVAFQLPVRANLATGRSTGEGNDRLSAIEGLYAQAASTLTGDGAANFLGGSDQRDVLIGGGGDDSFVGRAGNDQIAGGPGSDLIDGGAGNDALDGGAGRDDIVSYLNSPRKVTVRLASRTARGDGVDRLAAFEVVAGSGFGDVLEGSGSADNLQGKDGADTIRGAGGDDFLDGGGGRDRLEGGPAADYCFDGERNTGCEASDRSTTGRQSARRPLAASAPHPHGWLDALAAFVRDGTRIAIPADDSGPLSGTATLSGGDRYIYYTPECIAKNGKYFASIRPPRQIDRSDRPGALSVEWQASLTTKSGRVLVRTALAEATIDITNSGGVVQPTEWLVRRQPYRARPQPVSGTEPLRWRVELTLEGVELPHEKPPPCPIAPRR